LRAGEFLQPSGTIPGAHFVTDSDVHHDADPCAEPVDALEDLEPVASPVEASEPRDQRPAALPPPAPGETRGLQWYLNARGGAAPPAPVPSAPPPPRPASAKPELLGFDQTPSSSDHQSATGSDDKAWAPPPSPRSTLPTPKPDPEHEQKAEAKLFAYISGEEETPEEKPSRSFQLKGPIVAALALAACAVVAAPQAPWHHQVLALLGHGRQSLHTWLNPQPVTTAPAPQSHESFGRAGDEYKLPVAETIPDATTDPSQIRVVPVIDPTKKPNTNANPDPSAVQDPANTNPTDAAQTPTQSQPDPTAGNPTQPNPTPVQQNAAPDSQSAPQSAPPATPASPTITTPAATPRPAVEPHSETRTEITPPPIAIQPAPRSAQPHTAAAPANVPSSLKSQMASMTPEASGNKPPEAAMQSIEPVAVTEAAERALLTDQPAIDYPANAKGQRGTVILQVLIGRDGSVQDAKFLQGSLAFARTAIDGVKLWKFKPYSLNGRAVSVQTSMSMSFKP
jgi:protein TonB